ncbi:MULTISPECIES: ABC transporter ATP-binding protein [Lactobacillus]|uniref:ABC transporter ATP-binding protein n=1 Tax=Lactobacillus xujianguonis TaxID=2495899 RepID=A0A437SXG2_9LACO|nr:MULTISPECIES: ABC transporter ATP-binding protein [Lactobacillus]RVU71609.1 ABC transporter ATP-binding protein [Lactobacillus xujianguonis]RVU77740.1 ABC transporter ATP-binding protein [Lactobacillus xujianguonis]
MKYLFRYLKYEPLLVSQVVVLTIITSALRVVHALINVQIFNNLIALKMLPFFQWVIYDVAIFAVLSVFLIILQIIREKTVQYLSRDLRQEIVRHLASRTIEQYQAQDTGVYASWLTNDMTTIENDGFGNILEAIQIITDPLFSLIALIQFSWTFIPLVLFVSLLTVVFPQVIRKQLAKASFSTTKANEKLLNVINDALGGFRTFAIFGVEQQLENRIINAVQVVIQKKVGQVKYQTVANNIAGFSNILGQVGIQAWTGFLALRHIISIGVIASSGNLSYNVFNSLAVIAPIWSEMTALEPIFKKYQLNDTVEPKKVGKNIRNESFNLLKVSNLQTQFDHLPVFKHPLNFVINAKEKVAIHGESGSGKTTFMKILSGQLRNYSGSLKLNQIEEKELSYDTLRRIILYIDQTPYLFNDSIRYNLCLGEDFSDKQIKIALTKADLWTFIEKLPKGLNTMVGENGTNLSGGQKQRLALARGLLRNRQVILLDESTSNLDKASALQVENSFLSLKDLTVIFVSHQLHDENKVSFDQVIEI